MLDLHLCNLERSRPCRSKWILPGLQDKVPIRIARNDVQIFHGCASHEKYGWKKPLVHVFTEMAFFSGHAREVPENQGRIFNFAAFEEIRAAMPYQVANVVDDARFFDTDGFDGASVSGRDADVRKSKVGKRGALKAELKIQVLCGGGFLRTETDQSNQHRAVKNRKNEQQPKENEAKAFQPFSFWPLMLLVRLFFGCHVRVRLTILFPSATSSEETGLRLHMEGKQICGF